MTELIKQRPRLFRHFLQANMLFGLIVLIVAIYSTITGQYDSLVLRQQAETTLNLLAIGSLIYIVIFWTLGIFSKPYLPVKNMAD